MEVHSRTNSIAEGVPLSDPLLNAIRVTTTTFTTTDMATRTYINGYGNMSILARMRWFSNMIRYMEIDVLCYDCWIATVISDSIMTRMMSHIPDEDTNENAESLARFSTEVDVSSVTTSETTGVTNADLNTQTDPLTDTTTQLCSGRLRTDYHGHGSGLGLYLDQLR